MIKLIASDMDGTLLDSQKRFPEGFFDAIRTLNKQGTTLVAASGRQYASLLHDFEQVAEDMLFICENGALVMAHGERLFIDPIDPKDIAPILRVCRELGDVYPVMCRADVALIEENADPEFIAEVKRYYPSHRIVGDLMDYCDAADVCKVAFFDPSDAQSHELPFFEERLGDRLGVILSGEHWVDAMKSGVTKGRAMREMQKMLDVRPEECMAFGDYLNDYELLESVSESYAMANGHPKLKAIARHIAPSNDEYGVMQVIKERFSL